MARSHAILELRERFKELCDALTPVAGIPIEPRLAGSYRELAMQMERGDLAFAWMPPLPAIQLEDRQVATCLVLPVRGGRTTYHSAFVVRESGPKSIAELRGRRVAWVDKESTSGYVVPRLHLLSCGYDLSTFFASESFCTTHFEVVNAVASGAADVGATFCNFDAQKGRVIAGAWTDTEGASLRPVKVLATIGPIPNDAIVASMDLSPMARLNVKKWLLDLDGPARALFGQLLSADAFRLSDEQHFAPVRAMVARAKVHGFDPSLP
jgi:phosphonate transport system substrate-binding protein